MSDLLAKAIEFAARMHAGQVDKNGEPYILHPLRVMLAIEHDPVRYIDGVDACIAAVLHDVVEDCRVDLSYIEQEFGECVADFVDALSRRKDETYSDYTDRLVRAGAVVQRIKIADIEDNMRVDRFHPEVPYERMVKTIRKIKNQG